MEPDTAAAVGGHRGPGRHARRARAVACVASLASLASLAGAQPRASERPRPPLALRVGVGGGMAMRDCAAGCRAAALGGIAATVSAERAVGSGVALGARFTAWGRPAFIVLADPSSLQRLYALAATATYTPAGTTALAFTGGAGPSWYRARSGDVRGSGLGVHGGVEYRCRRPCDVPTVRATYQDVVSGTLRSRSRAAPEQTAGSWPFRVGVVHVGVAIDL